MTTTLQLGLIVPLGSAEQRRVNGMECGEALKHGTSGDRIAPWPAAYAWHVLEKQQCLVVLPMIYDIRLRGNPGQAASAQCSVDHGLAYASTLQLLGDEARVLTTTGAITIASDEPLHTLRLQASADPVSRHLQLCYALLCSELQCSNDGLVHFASEIHAAHGETKAFTIQPCSGFRDRMELRGWPRSRHCFSI